MGLRWPGEYGECIKISQPLVNVPGLNSWNGKYCYLTAPLTSASALLPISIVSIYTHDFYSVETSTTKLKSLTQRQLESVFRISAWLMPYQRP